MLQKVAILDFDDTLANTFQNRSKLIIKVAKKFDYKLTLGTIKYHWGKPFQQLITDLMPGINFNIFQKVYSEAMLIKKPEMNEGANSLLQYLKSKRILIFIVSSSSHKLILQDLISMKLEKYIDKIWGYEDTTYHKPDPRSLEQVFIYINNKNNINLKSCFSIGDSLNDYQVAKGNNIVFFAVTTGKDNFEDFKNFGMENHSIFPNITQLLIQGSSFTTFVAS